MRGYLIVLFLVAVSCDSGSIEGPPDLPEPDAFGVPVDSVTVSVTVDKGYVGYYYVRFSWNTYYEGWPVVDLPLEGRDYAMDTTFHAVKGDTVGVGFDVNMKGGGVNCLSYSITRHGTEEDIASRDILCDYGVKPKFFIDAVVP